MAKGKAKRANPHPLKYPIEYGGETITELEVRRVRVGDHVAVAKSKGTETEREVLMMSRLVGLKQDALEQLDEADFNALSEIVTDMREADAEGQTEGKS
jgi:dihydroxyacetone kinase